MKRRELLKTIGLAAAVNGESLQRDFDGSTDVSAETAAFENFLARLPAQSRIPDDRYDATFARRLDNDFLPEPDLFAGSDAHGALVSPQVMLCVGLGRASDSSLVNELENHGYSPGGHRDGRPLYIRRTRRRQRVAIPTGTALVVGSGVELESVVAFVRAVADPPDPRPLTEVEPAVRTVLDRLGSGTVLSISPKRQSAESDDVRAARPPRPLATGERLSLFGGDARLRTVAVYTTRSACAAAKPATSRCRTGNVSRVGRTLVRDERIPRRELELKGGRKRQTILDLRDDHSVQERKIDHTETHDSIAANHDINQLPRTE